jgi:CRP/FNR family transcriptional regulator
MSSSASCSIDHFFSQFPDVLFGKNEIILHPASSLTDVYFLKAGKVRMYAISPEGDEITLHIFRPPAYFPLMFILPEVENCYFFEVLEPSTVVKAPVASVIEFLKHDTDALMDLTKRFSSAMCGLLHRIENLAFENALKKVGTVLLYLSEKFGENNGANIVIKMELRHEDIAAWVGLRRETVSRQLEKLRKEQILSIRNKEVVLYDIKKLQNLIYN